MAKIAYGLYKGKFLNAVSVGFIPLKWENGTPGSAGIPAGEFRRKYLEQELLEVSAVGIPANPSALQLGLKAGAIEKGDLQDTLDLLRQTLDASRSTAARNADCQSAVSPIGNRHSQRLLYLRQLHTILKS